MGDAAQKVCVALLLCAACATARPRAEAEIVARSRAMLEAQSRNDGRAMAELYAPDYVYFSSIGKPDRPKDDEIKLQVTVTVESFTVEKPRVGWLDDGSAVLHYFSHARLRNLEGKRICPYSGAMEAWAIRDGVWKMVRRTEWLIGPPPAPPCSD